MRRCEQRELVLSAQKVGALVLRPNTLGGFSDGVLHDDSYVAAKYKIEDVYSFQSYIKAAL